MAQDTPPTSLIDVFAKFRISASTTGSTKSTNLRPPIGVCAQHQRRIYVVRNHDGTARLSACDSCKDVPSNIVHHPPFNQYSVQDILAAARVRITNVSPPNTPGINGVSKRRNQSADEKSNPVAATNNPTTVEDNASSVLGNSTDTQQDIRDDKGNGEDKGEEGGHGFGKRKRPAVGDENAVSHSPQKKLRVSTDSFGNKHFEPIASPLPSSPRRPNHVRTFAKLAAMTLPTAVRLGSAVIQGKPITAAVTTDLVLPTVMGLLCGSHNPVTDVIRSWAVGSGSATKPQTRPMRKRAASVDLLDIGLLSRARAHTMVMEQMEMTDREDRNPDQQREDWWHVGSEVLTSWTTQATVSFASARARRNVATADGTCNLRPPVFPLRGTDTGLASVRARSVGGFVGKEAIDEFMAMNRALLEKGSRAG